MLGKRKGQGTLFDVGALETVQLPPGGFHAQLAAAAPSLYPDSAFASLYHTSRGRQSVPPSQLALLLVLQAHAGVSDAEAIERSAFDARWAAVLGTRLGQPLCAKSTLQLFRAQLVLRAQTRILLKASLEEARRKGQLPKGPLRVAVDTLCVTGAGAVKDTWNLLAGGIWQVIQAAARGSGESPRDWAVRHALNPYVPQRHGSVKGDLDLDWEDETARETALATIVADAQRALAAAATLAATLPAAEAERVRAAATLLSELLGQDVETKTDPDGTPGVGIKRGTAPDRIPSATDPEQRHGRKSKRQRFTGHKARTVVETESGLILEAEVLPGNAGDGQAVLAQIERTAAANETPIDTVLGDCAFGSGQTRAEFAAKGVALLAKVPSAVRRDGLFPKRAFSQDLVAGTVTCPAGETTSAARRTANGGKVFFFGARCAACPLREQCTRSPHGRTVQQHPEEALLQEARAAAATPAGREALRQRVIVEHRQARLAQLGVKQARYFGRLKTEFQLLLAATVANLCLVWNRKSGELAVAA